jgi:hypothetical protein
MRYKYYIIAFPIMKHWLPLVSPQLALSLEFAFSHEMGDTLGEEEVGHPIRHCTFSST